MDIKNLTANVAANRANESVKPNLKGNNLTFTMYIEDTDVSFDLHFESKNFKGTVVYSEGILDITGVKKE